MKYLAVTKAFIVGFFFGQHVLYLSNNSHTSIYQSSRVILDQKVELGQCVLMVSVNECVFLFEHNCARTHFDLKKPNLWLQHDGFF